MWIISLADLEEQPKMGSLSISFFGLHLLKTQDELSVRIYVDMETRNLDVEYNWKKDFWDSSLFGFSHALKRWHPPLWVSTVEISRFLNTTLQWFFILFHVVRHPCGKSSWRCLRGSHTQKRRNMVKGCNDSCFSVSMAKNFYPSLNRISNWHWHFSKSELAFFLFQLPCLM